MHNLLLISLTLLLLACGSSKEAVVESEETSKLSDTTQIKDEIHTFNLQLSIQEYTPYCGGEAPSEEMKNNYAPVSAQFVLIDSKNNSKTNIISNNGLIQLKLKPGRYKLREHFKDISFNEFYVKYVNKDKMYYQNGSEECYKKWWNTNLFEFEIMDTTTVLKMEATLYNRCFTGNNPCIQYTGPYPP